MTYGYWGKNLRVDLSQGKISVEQPGDELYRRYWGGKGFIAHYLLREVPPATDALAPENKLIFAAGILTGLPVAAMSRFVVGAKAPLSGGYGQSEAGGYWGPELKKAGYDGIIIEGKAKSPVYLYIDDESVTIKEAGHIWGKDTGEAQDIIRAECHPLSRVALIGIGGENLVKYACIVSDLTHVNGRCGLGAVMGSKNLKALAVKGSKRIPFYDKELIMKLAKRFVEEHMHHPASKILYTYGTTATVGTLNALGILPTYNFTQGEFAQAEKLDGPYYNEILLEKRKTCFACPLRCKRQIKPGEGPLKVESRYGGPEYETTAAFGSLCGIDDLRVISKAHELCNKYALDSISTGATIAFVMECFSKGIIGTQDIDGLACDFGASEAILKLIEKIARREGIGDLLAEGSYRVAQAWGRAAEEFVQCVKKQELPMHDPRGKVSVGLGYALSETGADHMIAAHDTLYQQEGPNLEAMQALGISKPLPPGDLSPEKVRAFAILQCWWSFMNMAGVCFFGPAPRGAMPVDEFMQLIYAATGWLMTIEEVLKIGEHSINMTRLYNNMAGFTKADDTLPQRLFEPLANGAQQGVFINRDEFKRALADYYQLRGWGI